MYCNGTIRMQRGSIYEHIKTIKRLTPYIENHKVKTKNKSKNKNENYSIQYNKFNLKQTLRHDAYIRHQPYVTNVHILKSLLLKTLLTSVYAFTHRVLLQLQTSMHPYSTGESDISSSLVPLYQGVPAIPES